MQASTVLLALIDRTSDALRSNSLPEMLLASKRIDRPCLPNKYDRAWHELMCALRRHTCSSLRQMAVVCLYHEKWVC
jgi:hypothetical protein